LTYALYLGRTQNPSTLLEATTHHLPLAGRTATAVVPFGNSEFTFVATSSYQLGGAVLADLWWLIALLGAAMTLGAASLTERLVHRRRSAEELAVENGRLYAEQRGVAETLQRALLPEQLPDIIGLEVSARYVPGVAGLEIGGDWYDVLEVDEHHLLFVVGDVSGRGLRAATIMASIRYAIRAYALQGDEPSKILAKLTEVVDIGRDRHFATVLCGLIDTSRRELTLVNAGHPPALVRVGGEAWYLSAPVGVPIGVPSPNDYVSKTVTMPPGAMLIGFTDGLFERRGESLDVGLARLRDFVVETDPERSVEDLLNDIVSELTPQGSSDDVVLLGLRWRS
jgi:serine phosphatase RsbU (regulator of sigma subunit)